MADVELDDDELELLELLGTTGTETQVPRVYARLVDAGLAVAIDAGGGYMWIGSTPRGRRFVRARRGSREARK